MTWARIDDGFFDHPKARAAGKDGRALFLAGLCWAGRSQLEGVIDRSVLQLLAAKAEVRATPTARRLVEVGLWEEHPEGWLIHDYLDYNPTADKVKEIREKRAEAGRRGGQNSKRGRSKPEANCLANDEAESKQNLTPSSSSPTGLHPQTTSSGSRSDAWRDERNRNTSSSQMTSDWAQVLALAKQGKHQWRDNLNLSPTARRAASECAVVIRMENESTARIAFYDAWKRFALEGVK